MQLERHNLSGEGHDKNECRIQSMHDAYQVHTW